MSDWKIEDDIKAELRQLTDELRNLRKGLHDMVTPKAKPGSSRMFLHRESWPLNGERKSHLAAEPTRRSRSKKTDPETQTQKKR